MHVGAQRVLDNTQKQGYWRGIPLLSKTVDNLKRKLCSLENNHKNALDQIDSIKKENEISNIERVPSLEKEVNNLKRKLSEKGKV